MTRCNVTFRPATASDAREFYGQQPMMSFRGYVAECEGRVIGIGGVYYEAGKPVAFSEMKPEMRKNRKAIARACRMLEVMFNGIGRVYAVACQEEPTAPALLKKLGFVPDGTVGPHGPVLVRG